MSSGGKNEDENDPQRRSLADDPEFASGLDNLDQGLTGEKVPPADAAPARRHLPYPGPSPFDAILPADPADELTNDPGPYRPLLDMFPAERDVRRAAAAPAEATRPSVPPAPSPSAAVTARPTATPSSDDFSLDEGPPPEPYESFYGVLEPPFSSSTDPRFFFHSTPHEEAAQHLLTAIRNRDGLVMIAGRAGTGKTTLCRTVMEQIDRRTLTSFITDPFVTGEGLLKTILVDFGVMSRAELAQRPFASVTDLTATLQSFVESLAPLQASAVVIVDEAHRLSGDALEQVRILADGTANLRLLELVLVGEPALATLLKQSIHRRLDRHVAVRTALAPVPAEEIPGYIEHRFAVAGNATVPFDDDAVARIAAISKGVPRDINLLCDRALQHGYRASQTQIAAADIDAVAQELDLVPRSSSGGAVVATLRMAGVALALIACVLAGASLAGWMLRDAIGRAVVGWERVPSAPPSPPRPRPQPVQPIAVPPQSPR